MAHTRAGLQHDTGLPLQIQLPLPCLLVPVDLLLAPRQAACLWKDCVPAVSRSSRAGVRARVSGSAKGRGSNAPVPLNGPCEKLMLLPGVGRGPEGPQARTCGLGLPWVVMLRPTSPSRALSGPSPVLYEMIAEPHTLPWINSLTVGAERGQILTRQHTINRAGQRETSGLLAVWDGQGRLPGGDSI